MTGQDPFELLASLRGADTDDYIKPGDDPTADGSWTAQRSHRRPSIRAVVVAGS